MTRPTTFSGKPPALKRPTRIDELLDARVMARLDGLDVITRKIFAGRVQGERRSRRRGMSVEFADFRPYVHGDDLRFVDWNIYGRLDRLFLKVFLEEEDLSLVVVVDETPSMRWGNPDKFVFAQRLAMCLGYIGLVNHHRVTMASFGTHGLKLLANQRGRRRAWDLGKWILGLDPTPEERAVDGERRPTPVGFEEACKTLALRRQGRGVMIILSDFLHPEGYEKALRYVSGGGYDTFAMQVLSPEEIDPAAHGVNGDLRLVDVESGQEQEVTITPAVLAAYRERLDAYCGGLREFCVRRGVTHLLIDTAMDLDTLLLDYLRKRGLLR
jgi:uncharacterized protein (DUF58 family)